MKAIRKGLTILCVLAMAAGCVFCSATAEGKGPATPTDLEPLRELAGKEPAAPEPAAEEENEETPAPDCLQEAENADETQDTKEGDEAGDGATAVNEPSSGEQADVPGQPETAPTQPKPETGKEPGKPVPADKQQPTEDATSDAAEIQVAKTLKVGQIWNGTLKRGHTTILKLDVSGSQTLHILVEGKDIRAAVQKADRFGENANGKLTDPDTNRMMLEVKADAGSYLILLETGENSLMAKAAVHVMNRQAYENWKTEHDTEKEQESGAEAPADETIPDGEGSGEGLPDENETGPSAPEELNDHETLPVENGEETDADDPDGDANENPATDGNDSETAEGTEETGSAEENHEKDDSEPDEEVLTESEENHEKDDSEPDEEVLTESEENADPEPEEGSPDDGDATPATEEDLPEDSDEDPAHEEAFPDDSDGDPEPEADSQDDFDEEPGDETADGAITEAEEGETAPEPEVPRSVHVEVTWDTPHPVIGDTAHFRAALEGYDGLNYTMQWQYSQDRKEWNDLPGETGDTMDIVVTEENNIVYWRILVFVETDTEPSEE